MKKLVGMLLSAALIFALAANIWAAPAGAEVAVTFSTGETATATVGEPFEFFFQCDAPGDMGAPADGEEGAGITVTSGEVAYSNVGLGGPFSYPTSEKVTITGFEGDFEVIVCDAATAMDATHTIYFSPEDIDAAVKNAEAMAAQMAANPMGGGPGGGSEGGQGGGPEGGSEGGQGGGPGGEEMSPPPEGDSGGEPGGPRDPGDPGAGGPGGSDGGSGGDSGEAATVEDDGIDAAITFSDDGENFEREQTEGFSLEYYEGGSLSETQVTGFLFTSDDPSVNLYYSELSDNKGEFFTIGGENANIAPEETGVEFSSAALQWMEDNQIRSYDSGVILRDSGSDAGCEPVISAKGWTYLDICGLLLYAEGNARSAVYSDVVGGSTVPGPGAGGMNESQTPVVVIRNSLLETTGQSTARIDSAISFGNSGGRARGIQPQGMSLTYLYDSAIVSRTWGAFSTDSARQNLDLVAYNSLGYSTNGYGAYADTSCHLYLYGTTVIGSSDGITASNDGEIYAVSSDCTLDSTALRSLMEKTARTPVAASDYLTAPLDTAKESVIAGGSTAVQFHMPDQMHQGSKNTRKATLYMEGGTLLTDEKYVTSELSAYNAHFSGALLVTKSTQANVLLIGTAMDSSCHVLIHSMINSDSNVNDIPDGEIAPGSDYTFRNMQVAGDIINDDYQRALRLTLDGTELTGMIASNTCEDWNAFSKAELDGQYILNPDGYSTIWGVELTLTNGAVWNVTDKSTLTALSVEDGSIVNGIIEEQPDGTIHVLPLAAQDKWAAYIEYLNAVVDLDPGFELYERLKEELKDAKQEDYHGMEDGTMYGAIQHSYGAVSFEEFEIGQELPDITSATGIG